MAKLWILEKCHNRKITKNNLIFMFYSWPDIPWRINKVFIWLKTWANICVWASGRARQCDPKIMSRFFNGCPKCKFYRLLQCRNELPFFFSFEACARIVSSFLHNIKSLWPWQYSLNWYLRIYGRPQPVLPNSPPHTHTHTATFPNWGTHASANTHSYEYITGLSILWAE